MKFYYKDKMWHAIGNAYSRYWELHKGFDNCKMIEISRPHMEGFAYDSEKHEHVALTTKEFKKYLREYEKAYEVMLKRIRRTLRQV